MQCSGGDQSLTSTLEFIKSSSNEEERVDVLTMMRCIQNFQFFHKRQLRRGGSGIIIFSLELSCMNGWIDLWKMADSCCFRQRFLKNAETGLWCLHDEHAQSIAAAYFSKPAGEYQNQFSRSSRSTTVALADANNMPQVRGVLQQSTWIQIMFFTVQNPCLPFRHGQRFH